MTNDCHEVAKMLDSRWTLIEKVKVINGDTLEVTVNLGAIRFGGEDARDTLRWSEYIIAHKQDALRDVNAAIGDLSNEGQDIFIGNMKDGCQVMSLRYKTTVGLVAGSIHSSRLPKKRYGDSPLLESLQTLYDEGFWNANGATKDYLHHGNGEGPSGNDHITPRRVHLQLLIT